MKKKSQITLIIAIALLILAIAALAIYAANYFKKNAQEPLVFERTSVESYINNCVKSTAENGLKQFGKQGFAADSSKIPGIEDMQNQLAAYVNNNLNSCLNDFKDFENEGWNVEKGTVNAKAQINEQDVSFNVDYPIKVTDKANTISFDRFAVKLNVRLKYIHELMGKIAEFKFKYGKEADLSTLRNYDLEVTIFPSEGYFVYVIDDHKSLIMNEPYRFVLRIKE